MSEFKGTPGEWYYDGSGDVYVSSNYAEHREHIADLSVVNSIAEQDANGNLIAAAPDLLDALQRLKAEVVLSDVPMDYIESHFRPHLDKARAAIAKALGK